MRYRLAERLFVFILLSLVIASVLFYPSMAPLRAQGEGVFLEIPSRGVAVLGNSVVGVKVTSGEVFKLGFFPVNGQDFLYNDSDYTGDSFEREIPWIFNYGEETSSYSFSPGYRARFYSFDLSETMVNVNSSRAAAVTFYTNKSISNDLPVEINRTFTVIDNLPILVITTTIKNTGDATLSELEFYQFVDLNMFDNELNGARNELAYAPLVDGLRELSGETYIPRDRLAEPWLLQRDNSHGNYSLAVIFGQEDLFNGVYVGWPDELPPTRLRIDTIPPFSEISPGDISMGISWNLTLGPNETISYTYGVALVQSIDEVRELERYVSGYPALAFEASAPRAAYWGYDVPVRVMLNNTGSDVNVNYSVSLNWTGGLEPQGDVAPIEGTLGPGESYLGYVHFTAGNYYGFSTITISLDYTIYNESGVVYSGRTSRVLHVSVVPSPYRHVNISQARLDANGTATIIHGIPESLYHESNITIGVSSLPFLTRAKELITFTYGCTEQTSTKILAAITVYRYFDSYENISDWERAMYTQYISNASLLLASQQREDGGWGWYKIYKSTSFFTSYAVNALSEALKWQLEVGLNPWSNSATAAQDAVSKGIDYLSQVQSPDGSWSPSPSPGENEEHRITLTAMVLYSLANAIGGTNVSAINKAVQYLLSTYDGEGWPSDPGGETDPYTTALAIMALNASLPTLDQSLTGQVANVLNDSAEWLTASGIYEGNTVHWEPVEEGYYRFTPLVTALVVRALYTVQGASPVVMEGLNWLVEHTDTWLHFGDTWSGSTVVGALYALKDAYPATSYGNVTINLYLNGELYWNGTLSSGSEVTLPAPTVVGNNTVYVNASEGGRVYVIVRTVYWASEPETGSGAGSGGSVGNQSATPSTGGLSVYWSPGQDGSPGTRARGTLLLHADSNLSYLIVEIPLPSGYTFDPDEIIGQGYAVDMAIDYYEPVISIPIAYLPAGDTVINISLEPVPGSQGILSNNIPARVYGMYNPTVEASSKELPSNASNVGTGNETTPSTPPSNPPAGGQPPTTQNQTGPGQGEEGLGGVGGGSGWSPFLYILVAAVLVAVPLAFFYIRHRRKRNP